jgi:chromosome segregation ATPase
MSETGLITLIVAILSAILSGVTFLGSRKKTNAETDKTKAEAVKIYQEVASDVRKEQEEREDEWAAKFKVQSKEIDALKCDRDIANNEIAQLKREVQLTQAENVKLQAKVDVLEGEATNYRTAISTLLHENGALKEWCERLVKQFMSLCPGVEPEPFIKKARTNE